MTLTCYGEFNLIDELPSTGEVADTARSKAISIAQDVATTVQSQARYAEARIKYYIDELISVIEYGDFIVILNALKIFLVSIAKGFMNDI